MQDFMNNAFISDVVTLSKPVLFNLYFALASIPLGFPLAIFLALGKAHKNRVISLFSRAYIYAFRGSPLFIQFFMFYTLMLSMNLTYWKPLGIDWLVMHPLFLGPAILILNTAAYTAEIFYGALQVVPEGEVEAAKALGMGRWGIFKTVTWPHMIRLAWPAYTNEVVFLFHATALVYFTLPVINEQKDLMNKSGELFEKDYNALLHYSVAALYFLVISILLFYIASQIYKRMSSHLEKEPSKIKFKPQYVR